MIRPKTKLWPWPGGVMAISVMDNFGSRESVREGRM